MTLEEFIPCVRFDHLVCRRYEQPEVSSGGIVLPWRRDTTHTLFEVEGVGSVPIGEWDDKLGRKLRAADYIGAEPQRDDIIRVDLGTPKALPILDLNDYFLVWAKNVRSLFRWKSEATP